jgi:hypothetical protein
MAGRTVPSLSRLILFFCISPWLQAARAQQCAAETSAGVLSWPATAVGATAMLPCAETGSYTRLCRAGGVWDSTDLTCTVADVASLTAPAAVGDIQPFLSSLILALGASHLGPAPFGRAALLLEECAQLMADQPDSMGVWPDALDAYAQIVSAGALFSEALGGGTDAQRLATDIPDALSRVMALQFDDQPAWLDSFISNPSGISLLVQQAAGDGTYVGIIGQAQVTATVALQAADAVAFWLAAGTAPYILAPAGSDWVVVSSAVVTYHLQAQQQQAVRRAAWTIALPLTAENDWQLERLAPHSPQAPTLVSSGGVLSGTLVSDAGSMAVVVSCAALVGDHWSIDACDTVAAANGESVTCTCSSASWVAALLHAEKQAVQLVKKLKNEE